MVGVLLSLNRWIRLVANSGVAHVGERVGPHALMIAAALGSAVSTTIYGLVEDPTAQIVARILWGISYAALNLSTLAYAVSDRANAGKRVGASRAAIGLVQALSLVGGAWIVLELGARPVFLIFGAVTLVALCAAIVLPRLPPEPAAKKSFKLPVPHRLEVWGFVMGFSGDGVFLLTLAFLMKDSITSVAPESELGVQRAPLAHDFGVGARIGDLVDGDAGALVARDVADAVAAGLDAVHVDQSQQVHHVGRLGQRNPVELDVLARREVGVVGRQLLAAQQALRLDGLAVDLGFGLVVLAGDAGQHADLAAGKLAVGHGHAQHRRVALDVPAVLQPQRAELVFVEAALLPALELVAELGGSLMDELAIEFCVLVHRACVLKKCGAARTTGRPSKKPRFWKRALWKQTIFWFAPYADKLIHQHPCGLRDGWMLIPDKARGPVRRARGGGILGGAVSRPEVE
eukprot:gene41491-55012_t